MKAEKEGPTRGCCSPAGPVAEAVAPHTAQGLKRKAGEAIDGWCWSTLMTSKEADLQAARAAEAEKEAAAHSYSPRTGVQVSANG